MANIIIAKRVNVFHIGLILLSILLFGCATTVSKVVSKKVTIPPVGFNQSIIKGKTNLKVVVCDFIDSTKGDHGLGVDAGSGWQYTNISSYGADIAAKYIDSLGLFSKILRIPEQYNASIESRYHDFDMIIAGELIEFKSGGEVSALNYVNPLSLGAFVGVPTGSATVEAKSIINVKIIDVRNDSIINSLNLTSHFGPVHRMSTIYDGEQNYIENARSLFNEMGEKLSNALKQEPKFTQHTSKVFLSKQISSGEKINVGEKPGSSWAVIIGISKYQYSGNKGLPNLIFADDDAKAFSHTLEKLGWNESHMKTLINEEASQRNILIALESWLTKAGPNDQIILFWAGHGFPDPEDPEKVYFACYDTDINIPATGYRMDKVTNSLKEIGSKNVILLADTCHAGKLITRNDGKKGLSIVPQIKKMQEAMNIPKGWVYMVGADTDRQSIEHSSWSNGAFTHSLLKGLNGAADGFQSAGAKDGIVTMGELKDYMNAAMPDETQKVLGVAKRPIITTSTGDPDIWNLTLQAN